MHVWSDSVDLWRIAPAMGTAGHIRCGVSQGRTIRTRHFTHAESDWVQLFTDPASRAGAGLATGLLLIVDSFAGCGGLRAR